MAKYFGTNGARGKTDLFTPEFSSSLAAAFATWAGKGKILVGRDTRTTGEMVESAIVSGLLSAGSQPVLLGVVPSPTVEFETTKLGAAGAIVITASHNPPEWIGVKCIDSKGVSLSKERAEEVEKIMEAKKTTRAQWNEIKEISEYGQAASDHAQAIKKWVNAGKISKRKPKLVLDCGNGTACNIAPQLFAELGCEITTINSHPDGHFPGRNSEPTKENVADLMATVKKLGADAGIAWDGDGDRVIFIDERRGEFIIGDKSFALCVELALRKRKGAAVTTVATSNAIKDIATAHGCKLFYSKVGAPYISEKMIETKAVIGGEEVGGVIWPEFHYGKDGFTTAAKIVEAISEKPLSKWIASLPEYYNAKTKIALEEKEKTEVIEKLKKQLEKAGEKTTTIDGVRVDRGNAWCIIRPSGTEHYARIFAEAKTQKEADALLKEFEQKLTALKK
ncbi:phosphoglucosamine mutase [Candidatus Micrarchaeota archaeon]|nr:phosphoglucosamine mutase [Candidatus Micrarchaeota archaeon]